MAKNLEAKYGLPLATADNIYEIVKGSGIANWKITADPVAAEDYPEADLTSQEIKIKRKLQVEVSQFLTPSGKNFRGFHLLSDMRGTRVFTLLDEGLIPICAEFQHGCREVLLDLPGGEMKKGEDPAVCAKREFEEETGIVLKKIFPLSLVGVPVSARYTGARSFSFIGVAGGSVELKLQKLDANEHLKVVLISLDDWLKLVDREKVQAYSVSTTLLAMRRLKMFEVKGGQNE